MNKLKIPQLAVAIICLAVIHASSAGETTDAKKGRPRVTNMSFAGAFSPDGEIIASAPVGKKKHPILLVNAATGELRVHRAR